MSDYQEQVFGGLPFSLARAVESGGGIGGGAFLISLAPPLGGGQSFSATGADIDLNSDTGSLGTFAELIVDMDGLTQARLVANVQSVGPAGCTLTYRYGATHGGSFSDLVSGGLMIPMDVAGWQDTGWGALVAGAQSGVQYLHMWVQNDDASSLNLSPAYLMFK